jgi:hypothetical protein
MEEQSTAVVTLDRAVALGVIELDDPAPHPS